MLNNLRARLINNMNLSPNGIKLPWSLDQKLLPIKADYFYFLFIYLLRYKISF